MGEPVILVGVALVALQAGDGPSETAPDRWEVVAGREGARSFSGVFPHLASFNGGNECGTGAVVSWGDRLIWLTYSPHEPDGSDDRLYSLHRGELQAWSGSVGGTPANRLVHRESQQLFIGPYVVDRRGGVRVVPQTRMRGRLTGSARHLFEPARKVYHATMEEGLYEVDVETLEVTLHFADTHDQGAQPMADLPGYHGKGLYSGQGVLVYANNGEYGRAARERPDVASGVLAEWSGAGEWTVVRRNQFTEVTGPGGLYGNPDPERDPLWSVGWDHRSVILALRSSSADGDAPWSFFRLPKASHSYDGAHGWNTEWPRIRDVGEGALLMTMHGTFWRFPRAFDLGTTAGIAPRSTYLAVVGDVERHGEHVVLGCDDAARSEFLNRRRAKGEVAGPAESQSNLRFLRPAELDRLGPVLGRGGVWVDDAVEADVPSDAFLVSGYARRGVHLAHDAREAVTFTFEGDAGDGAWTELAARTVPAGGYAFHVLEGVGDATWVRLRTDHACTATAWFELRALDARPAHEARRFRSLATRAELARGAVALGGLVRAGDRERGLQMLATRIEGRASEDAGYYELGPDLVLRRVEVPESEAERSADWMRAHVSPPAGVVRRVGRSLLYVDDDGARWRLPIVAPEASPGATWLAVQRTSREVTTERDLFQAGGTFFELPARNAGGFSRVRPIASHGRVVQDYASWRGLLVLTGIAADGGDDPHVIRSEDGRAAVWLGAVDDLWRLGKPRGIGAVWDDVEVEGDVPSDPMLMTGYDTKRARVEHAGDEPLDVRVEVDITGDGDWHRFTTISAAPGEPATLEFPPAFAAYWVRFVAGRAERVTATLDYR